MVNFSAGLRKSSCIAETGRGKANPVTAQDSPTDEVFPGDMPTEPRKPVEEFGGCGLGATDKDRCKFRPGMADPYLGHNQAIGAGE